MKKMYAKVLKKKRSEVEMNSGGDGTNRCVARGGVTYCEVAQYRPKTELYCLLPAEQDGIAG